VVGEETVKIHFRSIYRKLGVNDRSHAVATVMRLGIFG
jgi:DNA-binding CsgD family transcriptional regulator